MPTPNPMPMPKTTPRGFRAAPTPPEPHPATPAPAGLPAVLRRPILRPPVLLLLAALLLPLPALAQGGPPTAADPDTPAEPGVWSAGFRLGLFDMVNAADSYDAVYGDLMPMAGLQADWSRGHWRFGASLDYGTVDGERVILAGGGAVIGTGIDQELTLIPVHLTAAWRFNPGAAWEWSAGAGPSFLSWDEDGPLGGESGTDFGASAVLALRWQRGAATGGAWDFGGELRWSTFPGALDDTGGVTAFFDEDDPGGLALSVLALRRF